MNLRYRVKRYGRAWCAFLSRPGGGRTLLYEGRTRHEAIEAMLNASVRMALTTPERLAGQMLPKAPAKAAA